MPTGFFPALTEFFGPDSTDGKAVQVKGRADWAFGYGDCSDISTFFVAVEAKRPESFSAQLLTYLAIIRERRIQAGKENSLVQGYYTDGVVYRFMMVSTDGTVSQSRLYEVYLLGQLKTIYNFFLSILQVAVKFSPNPTRTRDMWVRQREVQDHRNEMWAHGFKEEWEEPYEIVGESEGYRLLNLLAEFET